MSDKLITIDIVSQEGSLYEGKAKQVNLRGIEGEMGISYGHTQLMSTMPPGVVSVVKENDHIETLYVSGGIVEIQKDQVVILADTMERSQDLSRTAASEARQHAIDSLKNIDSKIDIKHARKLLAEAEARLRALNSSNGLYYTNSDHDK